MKELVKKLVLVVAVLLGLIVLFKTVQMVTWYNGTSIIENPSLESWDPSERIGAAWWAAQKYGGKE